MTAATSGHSGHHDEQGRPADSAGQAWEGKSIPSHGFSGDTGAADASSSPPSRRRTTRRATTRRSP